MYDGTAEVAKTNYNFHEETWFRGGTDMYAPLRVSVHAQSYLGGRPIVSFVDRLHDMTVLEARGTLIIDFYPSVIQEMSQHIQLGDSGQILLLSQDGTPVFEEDPFPAFMQDERFHRHISDRQHGHFTWRDRDRTILVGFATSDAMGWKVIGYVPFKEVFADILQIRLQVVTISILLGISIVLLSAYVSRFITKPLRLLEHSMMHVKTGDFTKISPVKTRDEIGRLTRKFNHMLKDLERLREEVYVSEIQRYKMELMHREAELDALQAQINPHFLYNALNTMACIGEYHELDEISNMSNALAKIFTYSIKGDKTATLLQEIEHVNAYIEIMNIRFSDRIECHIRLPEQWQSMTMLKLTLQPLVENAVEHGLKQRYGKGNIWIDAVRDRDLLVLRILDDGIGMSALRLQEVTSMLNHHVTGSNVHLGLLNVKNRLNLQYGDRAQMTIDSEEGKGTTVQLFIPLDEWSEE